MVIVRLKHTTQSEKEACCTISLFLFMCSVAGAFVAGLMRMVMLHVVSETRAVSTGDANK